MIQILSRCKFYKPNDNLNLTCTKCKKRCVLIAEETCYEFVDKEENNKKK